MKANLLISMRPPAPPTIEILAKDGDLFHPAVSSEKPVSLSSLTLERFAEARANIENHINSGKLHVPVGADVGIIPLGTGSAIPTKYRNGLSISISANWLILTPVLPSLIHTNSNTKMG
jgi:ribonuclease Z